MKKFIVMSVLFAFSILMARASFYVGASATSTAGTIETAAEDFDSDEMGWKAYAGVDFLRFLGVEASYRDLGSFGGKSNAGNVDVDVEAFDAAAKAFLPLGKSFNIFGKAGYANISYSGDVDVQGAFQNFDEDDWELFFGVGGEFKFGKSFAVRVEWEWYDARSDLSTLSAGLNFRF
jgi:major membrane immunogen (membrane-anchored lipoprotein)